MEMVMCLAAVVIALLFVCIYVYEVIKGWTPYLSGIFNGQRYIYHMTINVMNSEPMIFDLYAHERYPYPEETLSHLYDLQQTDSYVMNFGSRILSIRKDAITSIEMTITDTLKNQDIG